MLVFGVVLLAATVAVISAGSQDHVEREAAVLVAGLEAIWLPRRGVSPESFSSESAREARLPVDSSIAASQVRGTPLSILASMFDRGRSDPFPRSLRVESKSWMGDARYGRLWWSP